MESDSKLVISIKNSGCEDGLYYKGIGGAALCNCPKVGALRENIMQIPVWYI